MAEKLKPISKARATLPRLSREAKQRMSRYIITHEGQPQSVLLGFDEYQSMKAAVELLHRPEIVADIETGSREIAEGNGLSSKAMKSRVRQLVSSKEQTALAAQVAGASGVDEGTVGRVIQHLAEKVRSDVNLTGRSSLPGVGEIAVPGAITRPRPNDAASSSRHKSKGIRRILPHFVAEAPNAVSEAPREMPSKGKTES